MLGRTIWIPILSLGLGLGVGLLLSGVCGQVAPVVVQFGDAGSDGTLIRAYVSGAVLAPGVYQLHRGDRLVDAVEAAGGPAEDADTEAVNFARRIQDGEHLHVPRVGDPAATPTTDGSTAGTERVDLNRADVNLIRSLPGVGATRAANIIASRQRDGPFRQADDLVIRKLLTPTIFAQVRDLIEVLP